MVKFLMRAYNDKKLSEKEMEILFDVLNRLGFSDILTEEHDEPTIIEADADKEASNG